jgi:RNA polymerase sigma-70 factor, ECF subfamily
MQARQDRPVLRAIVRHARTVERKVRGRQSAVEITSTRFPVSRDLALITRVLAGEREIFYELIRPYERNVYHVAFSILRNQQDAEDAAQDTLLKALKKLHTFRGESKFSTWLIAIAVNEARARLRRDRIWRFESIDHAAENEGVVFTTSVIADSREVPLQAMERKELRRMLQQCIANLPGNYREVLMLRDVKELSIAETATALGLSAGVVKTRLLRARIKVRKLLSRSGRPPHAQNRSINKRISVRMWPYRGRVSRASDLGEKFCQKESGSCAQGREFEYAACA